jgi:uncharacterized protein (DUF2141 family)
MYITVLLYITFSIFFGSYDKPSTEKEVEVTLSNIKTPKGVFVISVFNDDKTFCKAGKELLIQKVAVNDTSTRTVSIKVPQEGWYAIALFQDEDQNGKIKQDKIGFPLEAYAFSNNVKPKTSAPPFSACKFYVGDKKPSLFIRLIQPIFKRKNK